MTTHDHVINRIVDEFTENRVPGWCPLQKALDLAAAVIAFRPRMSLEIGVFGGKSLLPIAMACEAIDHGVVIGIDPWSPAASSEGYTGENAQWWGHLDHEGIYRAFIAGVDRLGLKNRVAIERAKSDDAAVPVSSGSIVDRRAPGACSAPSQRAEPKPTTVAHTGNSSAASTVIPAP